MVANVPNPIVAAPDLLWGELGTDVVLFASRNRRVHVLNSSAGIVFSVLDQPIEVDDVVDRVAVAVGLTSCQIRTDIVAVLDRFIAAGICVDPSVAVSPVPDQVMSVSDESEPLDEAAGESISVRALGVPLVVDADDELLRSELQTVLASLKSDGSPVGEPERCVQQITVRSYAHGWQVSRNGLRVATPATREAAFRSVLSECNAAAIAGLDDAVVLHAAGVDFGAGVVVFPGVSNSGKSTLAAQFLERGHRYLTDEAVGIDLSSLRTRPFTKALCLEPGAQSLFPHLVPAHSDTETWDVDPRTIGPGRLSAGGPIRAVVFPTFDPLGTPGLRPLEPLDFLRLLIVNAFDFSHIGQHAFASLVRIAANVAGYQLTHDGGDRHLRQLEMMFGDGGGVSL